ncbi:unnamed protein product [Anisakis simplex]|uniref:Uncharacterized protein n=1 Tax=Anisakis simplex TaxID=6269 RepID=A0A0M3J1C3_ANISI|nr:unnamed protein product [Anisakis simplex]
MDDVQSTNEPPAFQHTRNHDRCNLLKPTFNNSTINQTSYKEICGGIARETVQLPLRKALEDKKNTQKGCDRKSKKPLKDGKTVSSSVSSNKKSNSSKSTFDVFCEETNSGSSTIETSKPMTTEIGGLRLRSETAEEQFKRVDPDAQIEHFSCWRDDAECYDSSEFRMTSVGKVTRKLQIDQVMRSVCDHKCDVISGDASDGGLLEDEILEEDVLDIPLYRK